MALSAVCEGKGLLAPHLPPASRRCHTGAGSLASSRGGAFTHCTFSVVLSVCGVQVGLIASLKNEYKHDIVAKVRDQQKP